MPCCGGGTFLTWQVRRKYDGATFGEFASLFALLPIAVVVGGQTLAAQGKNSVYFDIKVTDETNTKAEKAQYIADAFKAFAELLGNLHEESYIYVQDVRAAAYGYGGKTQEYRYQHA